MTDPRKPLEGVDDVRAAADAVDEVDVLRAWKREALEVLAGWDEVWEALGRPGPLGHRKSALVLEQVEAIKAIVVEEHDHHDHWEKRDSGVCDGCGAPWPCTIGRLYALVTGQPDPEPA